MTLIAERHTLATWGSGLFATDGSFIIDSTSDLPPADVTTASGKRPGTAVLVNYLGGTEPNTGADRCEKSINVNVKEGHIRWMDFWLKVDQFPTNATTTWNNYSQVRDMGFPANPSPSPAFGVQGTSLTVIRNLYSASQGVFGQTQTFRAGPGTLDEGGGWHHIQQGFRYTEAADGWVEIWRDGANVLPRQFTRTARESSAGSDWRVGVYRDKNSFGDSDVLYRMWGLEIHDERVGVTPPPPPPPPPDLPPSNDAELIRLRVELAAANSAIMAQRETLGKIHDLSGAAVLLPGSSTLPGPTTLPA